ncbi:MAG: hypothetical protein AB7P04_01430 [Bacteriovoracia bacterium]
MKERSFSIYSFFRGIVVFLSLIGVVISLGRCGPVASSLTKNQAFPSGQTPGGPGTIQGFASTVVAAEEYGLLPTSPAYNLTEGGGSELESFRTSGQVQLSLGNQVPSNAYFVVSLNRNQITSEMTAFRATYTPVSQGVWLLSVDPVVPAHVSTAVRQSLIHVRLWFGQ